MFINLSLCFFRNLRINYFFWRKYYLFIVIINSVMVNIYIIKLIIRLNFLELMIGIEKWFIILKCNIMNCVLIIF